MFRSPRLWIVLVSIFGVSLVLYIVIRVQGRVEGVEFAPSHFQERQFYFLEIPWIHLQISPIRRTSVTVSAAQYIRQKSLITVPNGQPSEWHLVSISRGMGAMKPADGELLSRQLKIVTGSNVWEQWSEDHPALATVFWPLVQRTATRELYVLLPRMFELAYPQRDAAELSDVIHRYLRNQYVALVRESIRAERMELADELLAEAIQDYPDDAELLALQAERPSR